MDRIASAWSTILAELGYDLKDDHFKDSPARVARFMREWHTHAGTAEPKLTTFANMGHDAYDGVLATGGIRFFSMCAHHGLPFFGTASVGYIPGAKMVGLSKLARVVDHYARRFSVQEIITVRVAEHLAKELEAPAVGVVLRAEHLCMSMRGIQKPGHATITSTMLGAFRDNPAARAELIALLDGGRS